MMKKYFFITSLIGVSSLTSAVELTLPKSYSVKYNHNFGKIDGFVQIPKGGKFGTTTPEKPEFSDLGIDKINFPDLEFKASWDKVSVFSKIRYNTFKGNSTLNGDLITHDHSLVKGDSISTSHEYITYSIGGDYKFINNENFNLSAYTQLDFIKFDYKYDISTTKNSYISGNRSFGWGNLALGSNLQYILTDDYNISLNAKLGIPNEKVRKSFLLSFINSYNIYRKNNEELNALFGVEFEYLEFRDTQKEMQNFMKHTISPIYKIGLEYIF